MALKPWPDTLSVETGRMGTQNTAVKQNNVTFKVFYPKFAVKSKNHLQYVKNKYIL